MPVYKDSNGTYYFRKYITKRGRTIQIKRRGFKTRKEAISVMESIRDEKEVESTKKKGSYTFQDLYNEYLNLYELQHKGQSIRRIKGLFENHILYFFKDYKLHKITTNDYVEWQKDIISNNFSDSYNKSLHGAMVTILNYAVKFHGLEKNVASIIGGFGKRHIIKRKNVWSYEEYLQFISVIDDIVDKILFETLYETGARFGEIAALTWKDFDGVSFNINKTVSKEYNSEKEYMVTTPKTYSSNRNINLSNNVISDLNLLKKYWMTFIGFDEEWFIFGGLKPYSHTTATRHKNEYCEMAKVKQITLHEFRHSHASLLLNHNIPITDVSERLGHSDSSITLGIYSHMIKNKDDRAVELFNKLNNESK